MSNKKNDKANGNNSADENPKGNSGNTNGGTETSFKNTPQAKDDVISNTSFGELNYGSLVYTLDVLANDLGAMASPCGRWTTASIILARWMAT